MKNYNSAKVKALEKKIVDNEIVDPELKEVINDVISYSLECELSLEDSEEIIDFVQY